MFHNIQIIPGSLNVAVFSAGCVHSSSKPIPTQSFSADSYIMMEAGSRLPRLARPPAPAPASTHWRREAEAETEEPIFHLEQMAAVKVHLLIQDAMHTEKKLRKRENKSHLHGRVIVRSPRSFPRRSTSGVFTRCTKVVTRQTPSRPFRCRIRGNTRRETNTKGITVL